MKFLGIILTTTILAFTCGVENAKAANFFPVGKENANTVYTNKGKCEEAESQTCYDITGKDLRYWELQTVQVDNYQEPIWKSEYNVEACNNSNGECSTIAESKICDDEQGDSARIRENALMPGYSVVCTRLLGYEQQDKIVLVENSTLKASVLAADAAAQASKNALAQAKAARLFGQSVIDMIAVQNISKGLSTAQIKQLAQDYDVIYSLLMGGAIATAKTEIQALTADGTLIRQQDKDELLSAINAYLGE